MAVAAVTGHVEIALAVARDKGRLAIVIDLCRHINGDGLTVAHAERCTPLVVEAPAQNAHLLGLPAEAVDGVVDLNVVRLIPRFVAR